MHAGQLVQMKCRFCTHTGDAHAHMSLARYYESGKGVEKSFDDAFKHHLTAAEMGMT